MSIDTIRVHERDREPERAVGDARPTPTVVEVSDVETVRATAYARESAARGHPEVYFERKGGHTFLVGN